MCAKPRTPIACLDATARPPYPARSENYGALEEVFKGMGVLDTSKPDLRRPGVEEPFALALKRCMSGGEGAEAEAESAAAAPEPAKRKLIQDADGGNRRRAFGQLYEELSELAFKYYFTIPSYYSPSAPDLSHALRTARRARSHRLLSCSHRLSSPRLPAPSFVLTSVSPARTLQSREPVSTRVDPSPSPLASHESRALAQSS
jgi:hypothetical protein